MIRANAGTFMTVYSYDNMSPESNSGCTNYLNCNQCASVILNVRQNNILKY